jgi:hypothetical protein
LYLLTSTTLLWNSALPSPIFSNFSYFCIFNYKRMPPQTILADCSRPYYGYTETFSDGNSSTYISTHISNIYDSKPKHITTTTNASKSIRS